MKISTFFLLTVISFSSFSKVKRVVCTDWQYDWERFEGKTISINFQYSDFDNSIEKLRCYESEAEGKSPSDY